MKRRAWLLIVEATLALALVALPVAGLCACARPSATPAPSPRAATLTPTVRPSATPTPSPTPTPARPPTRVTAPAIGLDVPVVEIGYRTAYLEGVAVTEWEIPSYAAGFHQGSAYPGTPGNTVISGHNNIEGEVFRHLVDLEVGDEVLLYVDDRVYRYLVASIEILPEQGMPVEVRIANARRIAPTGDERLTLVTCWPYTGNSHRVIVVARPAPAAGGSGR